MIIGAGNKTVKELLRLKKKGRVRKEENVFVAEGEKMVMEAPKEKVERLYVSETYAKKHREELNEAGFPFEVLSDPAFSHVSDTKTPQGILAVVSRSNYSLKDIRKRGLAHILVLDRIQDPGNLGSIFRTAEAAGATGILLSSGCADIYNPKAARSTMGAVYRIPFVYEDDICQAVELFKEKGIKVYAAHLEGKRSYDEEDYTSAMAFLIGNEANGLEDQLSRLADEWVRIPMEGGAESLNAAVAAAVLMFEVKRQRRRKGL